MHDMTELLQACKVGLIYDSLTLVGSRNLWNIFSQSHFLNEMYTWAGGLNGMEFISTKSERHDKVTIIFLKQMERKRN